LEQLQSDDSKYTASVVELLNEDSEDPLLDDKVPKLLYTLSVGMTSANTVQQKQVQLEQWIKS
jgi:hypothetical protein